MRDACEESLCEFRVYLNYPFDDDFGRYADAIHFGVVAAGLIPVCARDRSTSDRLRLGQIAYDLISCRYSAHELSRYRLNCLLELGMALNPALQGLDKHRCALFVATQHEYQEFVSNLAGLDPTCYHRNEIELMKGLYEWLRDGVGAALSRQATVETAQKYAEFKCRLLNVNGSGKSARPSHAERQELMFRLCEECKWWDWRRNRAFQDRFPSVPIAWKT